jgi:hypothetical protein
MWTIDERVQIPNTSASSGYEIQAIVCGNQKKSVAFFKVNDLSL